MMRKPRIDSVLELVVATMAVDAGPKRVLNLLTEAYVAKGVPELEALEYADQSEAPAIERLQRIADERAQDGRTITWQFNPSDPSHIQGACYVMSLDAPVVVAAKQRLKQLWESLEVISGLDPLDFERLCLVVLSLMGVHNVTLTPRRADQGIDFFGRLSVKSELASIAGYPPVLDMLTMWVVGQAKQFQTSQVATFDLRELVGSIELARAKAYGLAGDRYPHLDMKVADPVIALFFTSGQVSREARILARRSGVIAIDGELLAHLLSWGSVGFNTQQSFDRELFLEAVAEAGNGGDESSELVDDPGGHAGSG